MWLAERPPTPTNSKALQDSLFRRMLYAANLP